MAGLSVGKGEEEASLPSAEQPQGEVPIVGLFLSCLLFCPANPTSSPRFACENALVELTSLPVTILVGLASSHGNHMPLETLAKTPVRSLTSGEIDNDSCSGWGLSHKESQKHGPLGLKVRLVMEEPHFDNRVESSVVCGISPPPHSAGELFIAVTSLWDYWHCFMGGHFSHV